MIKKSKVVDKVDNSNKRLCTLLYPVNKGNNNNSSSFDTTQNYQTNQHPVIGLNDQTPDLPQKSKATVNTQLGE